MENLNPEQGQLDNRLLSEGPPASAPPPANLESSKPPGKRGRPKKEVDPNAPVVEKVKGIRGRRKKEVDPNAPVIEKVKGKRGRRKKEIDLNAPVAEKIKGKRGRRKKEVDPNAPVVVKVKGQRGRPKKEVDSNAPIVEKEKGQRGRRKKEVDPTAPVVEKMKGTRGRPKRNDVLQPVPNGSTETVTATSRRGRKPRAGKAAKLHIHLRISYHTNYGEALYVTGGHPLLGGGQVQQALLMQWLGNGIWGLDLQLETEDGSQPLRYNYLVKGVDGTATYDWGNDKLVVPAEYKGAEVTVFDQWNHPGFAENAYFSEPFRQVLLRNRETLYQAKPVNNFTHEFRVKAPLLQENEFVIVTGQGEALGNWNTEKPLILSRAHDKEYCFLQADLSQHQGAVVYKYAIYNSITKQIIRYEEGNNRFTMHSASAAHPVILNDGFIQMPSEFWRGAGVAIPVFSLRSKGSFGTGEFTDLKIFADWASSIGMKLIQILPVNDTTANFSYTDSYPYSAISAFALHPLYLNVQLLAGNKYSDIYAPYTELQEKLNHHPSVDYMPVVMAKWEIINKLYPLMKEETFSSPGYQEFYRDNDEWLLPYAQFCYLRDLNKTTEYATWPEHSEYHPEKLLSLLTPGSGSEDEIRKHFFVQYHLHQQLLEATSYCRSKGVVVKGDIPIGIYRNGVDAWQNPALYHLDRQAGAPPDDFAATGQNWGFPTYNWERMMQDGFAWWKQRFNQMSYYFDAFRIDHILGFFRIWSIPAHAVEGIMGVFVPALPVRIQEFYERNIGFDHQRFCTPFINEEIINTLFQENASLVKQGFLNAGAEGQYVLKPEFATQKLISNYFYSLPPGTLPDSLLSGLFSLVSNVILFQADNGHGQEFHFRFEMQKTLSFQYLNPDIKHLLDELYVDYFFRRQDAFWRQEAMAKLPVLKRVTNMLICGEDLGLVPASVPGVLKDLGLLSLEIQRMPKDPAKRFFHPNDAPYLSVVTPGTHDMNPLRGWWEEDRMASQHFFNHELGNWGAMPYYAEDWLIRQIINQHLYSPAMWAIFMIQDLFAMNAAIRLENHQSERINIPADPHHYWKYRMHLNLEELIENQDFNTELKNMIAAAGRN